ncbi:hypothetical protein HYV12_01995 [Candidatus Dojkabacteria bacterium]|nr:hypothetical protein [Candidatus Dojkabacteria bacterium]
MRGYVALTCVLIMIPLLLLTGVSSLYENITLLSISKMNYDSQVLKSNSETCIEETVYALKRDTAFTGSKIFNGEGWTCTVTIENKGGDPTIKLLTLTSSDGNGIETISKKELNTNLNPFELKNIE